jgi:predicted nucleic acid-binding protein
VIFDTDIFIWIQRGNQKAAHLLEAATSERCLSIQTYMELLQGAENKRQHDYIRRFIKDFGLRTLPFTENIGHRAAIYIEEYALSCGLRSADAIIAATASEYNLTLCTGNAKHFKPIHDLELVLFKP